MLRTHFIIICVLFGLAQITAVSAADLKQNPVATESALPYHDPQFDKIKDDDFVPAMEKEMAPKLSAHRDQIFLNPKLFARVQELYDQRNNLGLDPESAYLLERYYKDFVRAGAKLSDADKEKLKKINAELATLQTQFEQSVLKERNA